MLTNVYIDLMAQNGGHNIALSSAADHMGCAAGQSGLSNHIKDCVHLFLTLEPSKVHLKYIHSFV